MSLLYALGFAVTLLSLAAAIAPFIRRPVGLLWYAIALPRLPAAPAKPD